MSDQEPDRDPDPAEEDPRKARRGDQLPEEQPAEVVEETDDDDGEETD